MECILVYKFFDNQLNLIKMLVCEECGGKNIEYLCWVDVQTDKVLDHSGDYDADVQWCRDCKKHVEFKNTEEI